MPIMTTMAITMPDCVDVIFRPLRLFAPEVEEGVGEVVGVGVGVLEGLRSLVGVGRGSSCRSSVGFGLRVRVGDGGSSELGGLAIRFACRRSMGFGIKGGAIAQTRTREAQKIEKERRNRK